MKEKTPSSWVREQWEHLVVDFMQTITPEIPKNINLLSPCNSLQLNDVLHKKKWTIFSHSSLINTMRTRIKRTQYYPFNDKNMQSLKNVEVPVKLISKYIASNSLSNSNTQKREGDNANIVADETESEYGRKASSPFLVFQQMALKFGEIVRIIRRVALHKRFSKLGGTPETVSSIGIGFRLSPFGPVGRNAAKTETPQIES